MSETIYDLIVIGAGPGGYVAALRAARLGFSVALIEQRKTYGGVCLNEGCIPSKALLDSSELMMLARNDFAGHGILIDPPRLDLAKMMKRKDDIIRKLSDGIASLLKKQKVVVITGTAKPGGPRADGVQTVLVTNQDSPVIPRVFPAQRVLLATGSVPVELPGIPFDGKLIVNASDALCFEQVPQQLLVVGAGYVGLELGSVWNRLGSRVTIVEAFPRALPSLDSQVAEGLLKGLKKQGITFLFSATVTRISRELDRAVVTISTADGEKELTFDKVLVAAGRKPSTQQLGAGQMGLSTDDKGRLLVNSEFETSVPHIYALGDLIPGPMLAHKAMEEGVVFAERLAGEQSEVDYAYIPGVVYTFPEAASVGKTEEQLKEAGIAYLSGKYTFAANGRARCLGETDGFVKVLADERTGRILGVHILGPRASELIAQAVAVMSFGGTADDLGMIINAHPTLSEALKEAALDLRKRSVHG